MKIFQFQLVLSNWNWNLQTFQHKPFQLLEFPDYRSKVGCVFPMVISYEFRLEQYRDDEHREDTHHFTFDSLPDSLSKNSWGNIILKISLKDLILINVDGFISFWIIISSFWISFFAISEIACFGFPPVSKNFKCSSVSSFWISSIIWSFSTITLFWPLVSGLGRSEGLNRSKGSSLPFMEFWRCTIGSGPSNKWFVEQSACNDKLSTVSNKDQTRDPRIAQYELIRVFSLVLNASYQDR